MKVLFTPAHVSENFFMQAKGVDPDRMLHSTLSDLGLHCYLRPIYPNTEGKYGSISHKNLLLTCYHQDI